MLTYMPFQIALYGKQNEKEVTAFANGEVNDSTGATAVNSTRTRIDGVDAFASGDSNAQSTENSQGSPIYLQPCKELKRLYALVNRRKRRLLRLLSWRSFR